MKYLDLHCLKKCGPHKDLIESYKWMEGFNKSDIGKVMVVKEQPRTCSDGFKLTNFSLDKAIQILLC